jgi:hypothetical protein
MVLMVESICGQGFAYTHEVEEDWAKELVKLGKKELQKQSRCRLKQFSAPTCKPVGTAEPIFSHAT